MARLNEAGASIDPAELLLRKYSRQNKEIARINSTQCVRIRNLENEVSRLLAENLDLREQILRLQNEAECNGSKQIVDHVSAVKLKLEAKLLELGAVVTALGDEPEPVKRQSTKGGKLARASPAQSPVQKVWKNMCILSEAAGLEDGRLPPILEDKFYPRRTLEPTELAATLSDPITDHTDSPDIGPPPVSKFINEDTVRIDLPNRADDDSEEISGIDPARSINLEQRRKRKDTAGISDQKRPSRFEPNLSQSNREIAQSLKTGAKRKLSSRDDEDVECIAKSVEISPDDFKYTRKNIEDQPQSKTSTTAEKRGNKGPRDIATARGLLREKTSSGLSLNSRKALGPKTANTDVANSPRKAAKSALVGDSSLVKCDTVKRDQLKERLRERRLEPVVIQPNVQSVVDAVNIDHEPETPAAPDLFSPPASGSSAIRAESRDTPPPPDLGPGTEGQRPSRRARESVSYAEPNLRDKMRRPTKELVDAVTGEGKARRLSSVKLDNDAPMTSRKVKEEPDADADDAWKSMPSASSVNVYSKSPLVDKVASRDPVSEAMHMHQKRRASSTYPESNSELPRSGSSTVISALLVGPRKFKQEPNDQPGQKDTLENSMAKLDIYEFSGSSPREGSDMKIPTVKGGWHGSRASKRLSSATPKTVSGDTGESLDGEGIHQLISASSGRRQSMLGVVGLVSHTETGGHKAPDGMVRSSSHSSLSEAAEDSSRNMRVSGRRRSMML